jgi:hypothetical protein
MAIESATLKALIAEELGSLSDARVLEHIRPMLVEPHPVVLSWDYEVGRKFPCWIVLRDFDSGAEIGYCEHGFGPRCPWGLVSSAPDSSMGMDSGWYSIFLDAFFESFAVCALPIWKVYKQERDGRRSFLTGELEWDDAWKRVKDLRGGKLFGGYGVGHSITYRHSSLT